VESLWDVSRFAFIYGPARRRTSAPAAVIVAIAHKDFIAAGAKKDIPHIFQLSELRRGETRS